MIDASVLNVQNIMPIAQSLVPQKVPTHFNYSERKNVQLGG